MDLFSVTDLRHVIAPGAVLLRRFAVPFEDDLGASIDRVTLDAPFRHMLVPRGHKMSVAMTNCGALGWITDTRGYRYASADPLTGRPWPTMEPVLARLAISAASEAGYPDFCPSGCLINRYAIGAKMSLHQDKDEKNREAPIVSVSLGLPATFLLGGLQRSDPTKRWTLEHGDVVVWGGVSRLVYHGVLPVKAGSHPHFGDARINLTFRDARSSL